MSRQRHIDEAERALWRTVTRTVTPLQRPAAAGAQTPEPVQDRVKRPPERPAKAHPLPRAAPRPSPPNLVALERRFVQRLARGGETIDRRLDLHGRTQAGAHAALLGFLSHAQAEGARTVLVITGKGGRQSDSGRGILHRQVPMWLALPEFGHLVIGFQPAAVAHGGDGALYVRLRRRRQIRE